MSTGDVDSTSFEQFLQAHQSQLISCGIPDQYWLSLFDKLKDEIFDAGNAFQMQMLVEDDEDAENGTRQWQVVVTAEDSISLDDSKHIYLIDHAWTYQQTEARSQLENYPGLLERMVALMDIKDEDKTKEDKIDEVLEVKWKFNQTYSFGHFTFGTDESMPVWYIMDEFGSRIQHSDNPSFHIVPFAFAFNGVVYSIMWPLQALKEGDEVTRNYINVEMAENNPNIVQALMIPWNPQDMKHINYKLEDPDDSFFESYKIPETLPSPDFELPVLPRDRNLKVYTEYPLIGNHLTDPRFEIVETPEEADVLWYTKHYKDFRGFSEKQPGSLINQFPCESVITLKDMLPITARRASKENSNPMESNPQWLPTTYNMRTELPKFISYYQHREEHGLDNHWICKPWNLARSLDTHITKDLAQIVRLNESGPKVVSKYIENPVLFHREELGLVKFDIRYVVLLTSVKPLEVYAYQVFWLRFANRPYSLDHFDDYHKHFTVMNYAEGGKLLKQIHYDDFIPMFESQNPGFVWSDVENDIFLMIKELFESATLMPAPKGIVHNPQSRAAYAIDLILDWQTKPSGENYMQPKICEVNFAPDCDRACLYHPFFYNDLFSVMFLNDTEDKHVVPL